MKTHFHMPASQARGKRNLQPHATSQPAQAATYVRLTKSLPAFCQLHWLSRYPIGPERMQVIPSQRFLRYGPWLARAVGGMEALRFVCFLRRYSVRFVLGQSLNGFKRWVGGALDGGQVWRLGLVTCLLFCTVR